MSSSRATRLPVACSYCFAATSAPRSSGRWTSTGCRAVSGAEQPALTKAAQVECRRRTLPQAESPQYIFFPQVSHQVRCEPSVNAGAPKLRHLEQEFLSSELERCNGNSQAVYWQILLLLPYGKTGSEFHLSKQLLSLSQRNPS